MYITCLLLFTSAYKHPYNSIPITCRSNIYIPPLKSETRGINDM